MSSFMRVAGCVVGAVGLLFSATAHAQEIFEPGTAAFVGIGDAYDVEEGHPYFVGKFSGAYVASGEPGIFNHAAIMCVGYNDIGVSAAGYCVYTITSGATATLRWSCVPAEVPPGYILAGDCVSEFVSGTGELAGITGGNPYTSLSLMPNPDGTVSGVTQGGLTYMLP